MLRRHVGCQPKRDCSRRGGGTLNRRVGLPLSLNWSAKSYQDREVLVLGERGRAVEGSVVAPRSKVGMAADCRRLNWAFFRNLRAAEGSRGLR